MNNHHMTKEQLINDASDWAKLISVNIKFGGKSNDWVKVAYSALSLRLLELGIIEKKGGTP